MRAILSLPPSLLLLLATQLHAQEHDGQDNGPSIPTAVRKMSLDEGEKFMPEYYAFSPAGLSPLQVVARDSVLENAAINSTALAPFLVHDVYGQKIGDDSWALYRRGREVLARLQGRGFTCPGGTHSCADIDQPNYCCTDQTVCFVVENAPDAGNVGCCPDGQTCGGSVAACADGNTACPAEDGGGCCIPGFVCADIGCVASSDLSSLHTATATEMSSSTTSSSTPTATATSTQTGVASSSTGTGLAPVRATSSGPTPTPTTTPEFCPTGFYACLASAGSGCCRTGRDCSTTSCPPVARTTIKTHGATVVVALTDAEAAPSSSATCAGGWFLCGTDAGPVPGCCPSGYKCGTESCTLATATVTETIPKDLAQSTAGRGWRELREQQSAMLWGITLGWSFFFYGVV